jgi:hypothetical protein
MDWLTALDDLLCARPRHCLLCTRRCTGEAVQGIWDLSPERSVAYILCGRCQAQEGSQAALRARLVHRSEKEGGR